MIKGLIKTCCIAILLCITICSGVMQKKSIVRADYVGEINSKSALLIDYNSGTLIYEKNIDDKLPIASMVKLMTIYLTFKNIAEGNLSYDEKVQTTQNASSMGGSQVFIDPYVSYTLEDLLKSVIMASANDASVAIAEKICGSEEQFVDLMNQTAKEMGMENTLYCNCTGLPAPNQYSTARDCAILLKQLLKYDDYHKYSTIWMDELVHPSGRKTELVNTNKLIKYFNGCDSGKTGSTNDAGYCLTASANRDNMRLISVVIGAKSGKDRFKESTELLNYGFANYTNKKVVDSTMVIQNIKTKRCKQELAEIVAVKDFYAFDKKGNKSSYKVDYELPEIIHATKSGEVIGRAIISKDGNLIETIDLTVKNSIESKGIKDNFKDIINCWY